MQYQLFTTITTSKHYTFPRPEQNYLWLIIHSNKKKIMVTQNQKHITDRQLDTRGYFEYNKLKRAMYNNSMNSMWGNDQVNKMTNKMGTVLAKFGSQKWPATACYTKTIESQQKVTLVVLFGTQWFSSLVPWPSACYFCWLCTVLVLQDMLVISGYNFAGIQYHFAGHFIDSFISPQPSWCTVIVLFNSTCNCPVQFPTALQEYI